MKIIKAEERARILYNDLEGAHIFSEGDGKSMTAEQFLSIMMNAPLPGVTWSLKRSTTLMKLVTAFHTPIDQDLQLENADVDFLKEFWSDLCVPKPQSGYMGIRHPGVLVGVQRYIDAIGDVK